MTRQNGERVSLSLRDWFAAVALVLALAGALGGVFVHVDRSLVELSTCQMAQSKRLGSIEADIRRLESRIFREVPR